MRFVFHQSKIFSFLVIDFHQHGLQNHEEVHIQSNETLWYDHSLGLTGTLRTAVHRVPVLARNCFGRGNKGCLKRQY